jgi:hypothetical protein
MRVLAVALAVVFATAAVLADVRAARATPWLFVTDIHLEAASTGSVPAAAGHDTNAALFESAIAAMRRVDPQPPVVVVTGDLLAHHIADRDALAVAVRVAHRLNAAFPQAQFVLALGNEDSGCGDYTLAPDSAFLRAVTAAWAPLVNRRGAAPDFARTFAHDGFYTATLPVPGLHAVVVDDVFWSPWYHANCGAAGNVIDGSMDELDAALQRLPGRAWVLAHIPPGVDAFSTAHLVHDVVVVPFLVPSLRDRFLAALDRRPGGVAVAVVAHTHKFAFRIVDANGPHPIPMLLVPALSPIYANAPSFLTANVAPDGTLRRIEEISYLDGAWRNIGGMPSLGVDAFTGPQLVALHGRLDRDPALRATFERLYEGGGKPEIDAGNWPVYSCAATAFSMSAFRACEKPGGAGFSR